MCLLIDEYGGVWFKVKYLVEGKLKGFMFFVFDDIVKGNLFDLFLLKNLKDICWLEIS